MSASDFTIAAARMFAVSECCSTAISAVREAMDAEADSSAKAAIWDHAAPIFRALTRQSEDASAAFNKAKQEAGL